MSNTKKTLEAGNSSTGSNPHGETFSFLTLAPVQSASYPTSPVSTSNTSKRSSEQVTPGPSISIPAIASPSENTTGPSAAEIAVALKTTRSSSTSTVDSESTGRNRFLKLGPVHWGGNPGVSDWADE
ncbi:MAG: hypothetical protein M1836_005242 [Candelina mexicana]|nr:MAG: hypothetical protein M1836_005242 [Candelina mexicana]